MLNDNLLKDVYEYINNTLSTKQNILNYNTDGQAVKTGNIIDGKEEYIKRYSFKRTQNSDQTISKDLGFILNNVIITKMDGTALSNSKNWFDVSLGDYRNLSTYANKLSLDDASNKITVEINVNFDTLYVDVCYINKS